MCYLTMYVSSVTEKGKKKKRDRERKKQTEYQALQTSIRYDQITV